jgi:16S rRNA processing protein RimM
VSEGIDRLAVGRITRAHGVGGEVAVLPLSQVQERFEPGSRLSLEASDRTLVVTSVRPHRNRLLVSFEGVEDRNEAETLAGRYLFVPAESAPPLPDGEYWPHQLVGSEVVTESGRVLGRVREVLLGQANDVWVTVPEDPVPPGGTVPPGDAGAPAPRPGPREWLVPALRDVVVSVDPAARRIVVRDVPGLTAPEEGASR